MILEMPAGSPFGRTRFGKKFCAAGILSQGFAPCVDQMSLRQARQYRQEAI
jgi:hypothetical protein